jgi:microcin C transport system substrate-binding protein
MPALATHWQIAPDKVTFRFRIDPNARWSDGQPVVAEDIVATWKLETDKGIQDPFHNAIYGNYEQPVAESKYIVRVKAKEPKWVNFYYFSTGMMIYPAHVLKGMNGETFIRDWNYKMVPGTGPYIIREADVNKGNSISLRRRPDYWAGTTRRMVGRGNFDEIRYLVVREETLEFEMLKKGDIDNFLVTRAQMWAEELDFDKIQNGQLQKRKIYNHEPQGLSGFAFNTRRPPFDEIRVRKAVRHLLNREQVIEKLMFGAYDLSDSHYPASPYENPNNEKVRFDPQKALALLAEAGWKDRDSNGRLTRNGQPLAIELLYYDKNSERYLTVFQEEYRKVGITFNLRYATPETAFQLKDDFKFDVMFMIYGAGTFPTPRQMYHSSQYDVRGGDNLTGFNDKRLDELVEAYDTEFDFPKRVAIMQELDGIVTNQHHWAHFWHANFTRYVYWNKFGTPNGYITRIGASGYYDPASMWWIDPDKAQKLEQALRDPSIKLEVGPSEDRYWLGFKDTQQPTSPTPNP